MGRPHAHAGFAARNCSVLRDSKARAEAKKRDSAVRVNA